MVQTNFQISDNYIYQTAKKVVLVVNKSIFLDPTSELNSLQLLLYGFEYIKY